MVKRRHISKRLVYFDLNMVLGETTPTIFVQTDIKGKFLFFCDIRQKISLNNDIWENNRVENKTITPCALG